MQDHRCSRRTAMVNLLGAAASMAAGMTLREALAQSMPEGPRGGMGQYIEAFRRQFRVPAMSVALSRNGRFVFDRAGGMADGQHLATARQNTLFRIADLSQSVTAVAIFSLVEAGKVRLADTVFGPGGLLGTRYGKGPYEAHVTEITVDHLLTHTTGGWAADANDPMMRNHGWDQTKLITSTIESVPLTAQPGTHWIYSNFGYCILGRVIEAVTSESYETWVQSNVLAACGITGMQIAKNSERDRAPDEAVYVGQYSEEPYKFNVARMDSCAGWIASSTQLVQFLDHVGGAPGIAPLLKPGTIRMMTTPAPAYPQGEERYARGWMVAREGAGNWWHSGSLPGSTALMIRQPDSSACAAICNTRTQPHQEMDDALDAALLRMLRAARART